jgi:hypothetical protein
MNHGVFKNSISYIIINERAIMKAEIIICVMGLKKPTKTSLRRAST